MAAKARAVTATTDVDLNQAATAFEALLPEANKLDRRETEVLRVDPQLAAAFAYSLAVRDGAPARRERLGALESSGLYSLTILDALAQRSLATFHARRRQLEASAVLSAARLPEPTVREAQELRQRMLRVLEYHLDGLPEHARRLEAIRAGTGHQDLANDLLALHDYYGEPAVAPLISRDATHYRANDAARAAALGEELFRALGLDREGEAARWADATARCVTLLLRAYDSHRAAGQLVFRKDEDVEVTFPSLISAVRSAPTRAALEEVAAGDLPAGTTTAGGVAGGAAAPSG